MTIAMYPHLLNKEIRVIKYFTISVTGTGGRAWNCDDMTLLGLGLHKAAITHTEASIATMGWYVSSAPYSSIICNRSSSSDVSSVLSWLKMFVPFFMPIVVTNDPV